MYEMILVSAFPPLPYDPSYSQPLTIPGRTAVPFLTRSNLPRPTLKQMWTLVDPEHRGSLTARPQAYTLLRMISIGQYQGSQRQPIAVNLQTVHQFANFRLNPPWFQGLVLQQHNVPSPNPQSQVLQMQSPVPSVAVQLTPSTQDEEEEFGDFASPPPAPPAAPVSVSDAFGSLDIASAPALAPLPPIPPAADVTVSVTKPEPPKPVVPKPKPVVNLEFTGIGSHTPSTPPAVASADADDEEFGDFETVPVPPTAVVTTTVSDAFGSLDGDDPPLPSLSASSPKEEKEEVAKAPEAEDDDEDFGEFEDFASPPAPAPDTALAAAADDDFGDFDSAPAPSAAPAAAGTGADNDDDFGDFESVPVPTADLATSASGDDDFGGFDVAPASVPAPSNELGDFSSVEAPAALPRTKSVSDAFGSLDVDEPALPALAEIGSGSGDKDSTAATPGGEEEEEDFGDFDSAPAPVTAPIEASDNEDFGDFDSAPAVVDGDDEDFGDFDSAPIAPSTAVPSPADDEDSGDSDAPPAAPPVGTPNTSMDASLLISTPPPDRPKQAPPPPPPPPPAAAASEPSAAEEDDPFNFLASPDPSAPMVASPAPAAGFPPAPAPAPATFPAVDLDDDEIRACPASSLPALLSSCHLYALASAASSTSALQAEIAELTRKKAEAAMDDRFEEALEYRTKINHTKSRLPSDEDIEGWREKLLKRDFIRPSDLIEKVEKSGKIAGLDLQGDDPVACLRKGLGDCGRLADAGDYEGAASLHRRLVRGAWIRSKVGADTVGRWGNLLEAGRSELGIGAMLVADAAAAGELGAGGDEKIGEYRRALGEVVRVMRMVWAAVDLARFGSGWSSVLGGVSEEAEFGPLAAGICGVEEMAEELSLVDTLGGHCDLTLAPLGFRGGGGKPNLKAVKYQGRDFLSGPINLHVNKVSLTV